jgi:TetR/AcrR family transcriptional repressor of nem operon
MDTRDKILNSALRLIQTRSFHGFSFQDIADEVGIRKASLYHYFDSKDAVALAVLERIAGLVKGRMEELEGLTAVERLRLYFDVFRGLQGKAERMCPGGSFGAIFGAISTPVQAALHRFTKTHLDGLESIVRDGVARGEFAIGDQRPRDIAVQIFAGIQGALLTGRLTGDPHVIDAIETAFCIYLTARLRSAPPQ